MLSAELTPQTPPRSVRDETEERWTDDIESQVRRGTRRRPQSEQESENTRKRPTTDVRVVCAVSDEGYEMDEVIVDGHRIRGRRCATFEGVGTSLPLRLRIVGRHIDAVADVRDHGSKWYPLYDGTHDDDRPRIGEVFVATTKIENEFVDIAGGGGPQTSRRRNAVVLEKQKPDVDEEWRRTARALYARFSTGPDEMTLRGFEELTKAAFAVGGNLKTLGGSRRSGCFGYCVTIPEEDLFAYVLHRHSGLRVCYGGVGLAEQSSWHSRLALVGVSLLWSLSANCLVSAIVIPQASRMTQVLVITVSDSTGTSILTVFFYILNSPTVARICAAAYRLNVPAILTTLFAFATLMVLLVSLAPEDLYLATYSFLPIWCTARAYDIFRLGATWAVQVQLGSYPPRPQKLPDDIDQIQSRRQRLPLLTRHPPNGDRSPSTTTYSALLYGAHDDDDDDDESHHGDGGSA